MTATPLQSTVVLAQPSSNLAYTDIVMTSTQTHVQDQLQRKHEELQQLIAQQQEELRRVSEQLLMARYGLLPSLPTASNTALIDTVERNIQNQSLAEFNVCNQQLNNTMDTGSPPSSTRQITNADICSASDEAISYIDLKPSSSSNVGLEYIMHNYQQHQNVQGLASDQRSVHSMSSMQQQQHLPSGSGMQEQPLPELNVYNQQLNNAMDTCTSSSGRQIGKKNLINFLWAFVLK